MCSHKIVCKHFAALGSDPDSPCPITETCRFYATPDLDPPRKGKRPYKKRIVSDLTLHDDMDIDTSGITEKQFKKAKKKIVNARQNKGLTDNQESALKAMKGLRFKKMSVAQKEQIISIAKDL